MLRLNVKRCRKLCQYWVRGKSCTIAGRRFLPQRTLIMFLLQLFFMLSTGQYDVQHYYNAYTYIGVYTVGVPTLGSRTRFTKNKTCIPRQFRLSNCIYTHLYLYNMCACTTCLTLGRRNNSFCGSRRVCSPCSFVSL